MNDHDQTQDKLQAYLDHLVKKRKKLEKWRGGKTGSRIMVECYFHIFGRNKDDIPQDELECRRLELECLQQLIEYVRANHTPSLSVIEHAAEDFGFHDGRIMPF